MRPNEQIAAGNAEWPVQFRFAVCVARPRMAELLGYMER
jgi:hypothetical protein